MVKHRRVYLWLLGILLFLPVQAMASDRDPKWEEVDREGSLVVYRKKIPGSNLLAYKGAIEINAPMAKIVALILDTPRRPEWIKRIGASEVLREHTPRDKVEYVHVQAPWPLRDRDFVYRIHMELDPMKKTAVIRMASTEDPKRPEQPGKIRASVTFSTVTLKPLDGGSRTFIEAEAHGDPKGSIPGWIVNLYQKRIPRESLHGVMRQLAKTDVLPHPEIVQLLNDSLPSQKALGSTGLN